MELRNKMTNPAALKLLIFGGTGVLGQAIAAKFKSHGYEVTYGVRKVSNPKDQFLLPITDTPVPDLLKGQLFDAIIFAQGANINDSVINNFTRAARLEQRINISVPKRAPFFFF